MRKKLSEMAPGERGRVVRVDGAGDLRRKLMDMGIVRGVTVELVRRAPLGDPVEVSLRGYNLSLRAEEAEIVHVDVSQVSSDTSYDATRGLPTISSSPTLNRNQHDDSRNNDSNQSASGHEIENVRANEADEADGR